MRALAALLALLAVPARAYCLRSVCEGREATLCAPAHASDCGAPVRWASRCVSFSLHRAPADDEATYQRRLTALTHAFEAWAGADCGGGRHPGLRVQHAGPVQCDRHEFNRAGGNANVVAFTQTWSGRAGDFGLTQLTYDRRSGAALDADLTFNAPGLEQPTAGASLGSVALHEAGHFLGLAHSEDAAAVMSGELQEGSERKVALTADDRAAICALYPPGAAPVCGAPAVRSACAQEAPSDTPGSFRAAALVAGALALLGLWWTRRQGA